MRTGGRPGEAPDPAAARRPSAAPLTTVLSRPLPHLSRKRLVFFAVTLVGLYIVWPQLVKLFDALPALTEIRWYWFAVMLLLEVGSYGSYWVMMRVTVGDPRWFVVGATNLASVAFSRIVPGGAASGGAAGYQMLAAAGLPKGRAVTGLTVTTLLSTAVLFVLPVLSLPAILGGAPVDRSLLTTLWLGLGLAALIVVTGAVALFTDRPLQAVSRLVGRLLDRLRPSRAPHAGLAAQTVRQRDLIKRSLGRRWWQALLGAAGNWLFDYGALLAALAAVGARPRPSLVLVAYVVASLMSQIPLTPGGLGFVELGLVATLGLAGVGGAEATAAVLAYRLVSFWLPIPVGAIAFGSFRRRFSRGASAARTDVRAKQ